MHDAGEMDTRACYTAISVGSRLNILDAELVKDVGNFILSCQTYEGGIAGEPGSEAHGGYTFCGLAAMILINEADKLDLPHLIDWVAFRQGVECGFQGRINKLVDGCYSFWQGGALALLQRTMKIVHQQLAVPSTEARKHAAECETVTSELEGQLDDGFSFLGKQSDCGPLFHSIALQQYILLCSQVLEGGFKDKPGKYRDHYHSCYCLSGLSICQYSWSKKADSSPLPNAVLGPYSNLLEPVHPLHNVVLDKYLKAHEFFWGS